MRNIVISDWKDFGGKEVITIKQLPLDTVVRLTSLIAMGR